MDSKKIDAEILKRLPVWMQELHKLVEEVEQEKQQKIIKQK